MNYGSLLDYYRYEVVRAIWKGVRVPALTFENADAQESLFNCIAEKDVSFLSRLPKGRLPAEMNTYNQALLE